jgi:hypothetical protein
MNRSLRQWLSKLFGKTTPANRPRRNNPKASLGFECLEDRLAPATFTDNGTTLNLVLNNANTNVAIISAGTGSGGGYFFTLTNDTWSGTNDSNVTGSGTSILIVPPTGIAAFTNQISVVDAAPGDSVTFDNSGTLAYANNFNINLSNAAAGPITFKGTTTFSSGTLTASTTSAINFQGGTSVPYQGTVTFTYNSYSITMPSSGPGWAALGFAQNESVTIANAPNVASTSQYVVDSVAGDILTFASAPLTSSPSSPPPLSIADANVTVAVTSAQLTASTVSLTAGDGLTVQSTGVPYLGGVTINAAPQPFQPYAEEQYITGPDWASYGYEPGDIITLQDSNGTNNYTVANIAGDNLYLISSQNIPTGTYSDVTVSCQSTPEITALRGLTLKATGTGNAITGAIATTLLNASATDGNITLQDLDLGPLPLTVGTVNAGIAQINLDVNGPIVADTTTKTNLTAVSVNLTTTGLVGSIGTNINPITTQTEELTANTNDGSIYITNTGPLTINSVAADQDGLAPTVNDGQVVYNSSPNQSTPTYSLGTSDVTIVSTGAMVLNSISATGDVAITGEYIVEGNTQSQDIVAPVVDLTATGTANYQGQVAFANDADGDTMTLPDTGPTWTSFGFSAGDAIVVSGASAVANDAAFTIASISPDGYTLTLTESYVLDSDTEPDVTVGDGMIGLASAPISASAASSPGAASAAIDLSEVGSFSAVTKNGNIYLAPGAAINSTAVDVTAGETGSVSVTSDATFLTVDLIDATGATPTGGSAILGGTVDVDVNNGSLLEFLPGIIQGNAVSLTSASNIGSPSSPIMTNAASRLNVAATADSPSSADVYVDNTSNLSSVGARTYAGNVLINYNGNNGSYAGQLSFSSNVLSQNGGAVVTFANTDDSDGSDDNVVLSGGLPVAGISAGGQILSQNAKITGQFVMLSAGDGIGIPGTSFTMKVAALDATTNTGGIYIQNQVPQGNSPIEPALTFAPNPQGAGDTITLPNPGPTWRNYGYAPGDTFVVSGASDAANDGAFTIASISADGYTATLTAMGILEAQNANVTVIAALPVSASTSNGNINLSSQGDMILGGISTNASGTVTLDAGDNIYNPSSVNAKSATVSGGTLVLTANEVGTASNPLETSVASVTSDLTGAKAALFLNNNTSLTLTSQDIMASVFSLSTTGNLTLAGTLAFTSTPEGSLSLTATAGTLTTTGNVTLDDPTITISAEQIGSPTDVIQTGATTINATATYGGIYISNNTGHPLTLTAAAVGPDSNGAATNNIEIYSAGSVIIDPQMSSLVTSQPVGLYNPGGSLTLYAGETLSANGQNADRLGLTGLTITSDETISNPGAYYDVFTGAQPTIVTDGNPSGVSASLQIKSGQSEPQVTQPGGGSGSNGPPLLITEAQLEKAGGGTYTASSITIDDDMDSNGQSATIELTSSITLTATNGPIVFINPNDTLESTNGGTITLNADGSNGVAVLGNLTTGGGSITVSASGNISIGAVNAGSGHVTITSTSGSIFSNKGTALAISAGSTIVQGAGVPASASQSTSLVELNATQAIAMADAASAQAAAEQTTTNAFLSELTSINSQLTSIQTAVGNDQQNYQAEEQLVANDTNRVNIDAAVVNNETIAEDAFNTASAVASLAAATTDGIAYGLALTGALLGEIPVVGEYLWPPLLTAAEALQESADGFNLASAIAAVAAAAVGDQQIIDSNKLTSDSNTLATDESNEAEAYGQLQADVNAQTDLTDVYDATLQAYDIAQQAAAADQAIAMQDQAVSGQAIAAVAATATPQALNVNGPIVIEDQANVVIPSGVTIQAASTSAITITGGANDDPAGASVTVDGMLSAASALLDVPSNSTGPDTFNVNPSATTPITVTGGEGTDTLNFNAEGLTVAISGDTITAAGMKPVTFTNIAVVNISDAVGNASFTLTVPSGTPSTSIPTVNITNGDVLNYTGSAGDTVTVTPSTATINQASAVSVVYAGIKSVNLAGSGSSATLAVVDLAIDGWMQYLDSTSTAAGAGNFTAEGPGAVLDPTSLFTYQGFANVKLQATMSVTAGSGTYNGKAFSATALVNGTASLDNITPTLTYYSGTSASGTGSSTAPTNAGTYTVMAYFAGDATYGSASATTTFTINPAPLTASIVGNPTKVYDGTTAATLKPANYKLTGLIVTQSFTVTLTAGTYNGKDVSTLSPSTGIASATTLTASLSASNFTAGPGTLAGNYVLPLTATGPGTITPKRLTASIVGEPTKVSDGTTNATLTPANYGMPTGISGEGFKITQTAGSYNSKKAGSATSVTATLTAGNFTPLTSTVTGDYTLPSSATGKGQIISTSTDQVSFRQFVSSVSTSVPNQPISLTATLTAASGVPVGSVDFFDQTTQVDLGSVPVSGSGVAALTATTLTSLDSQMISATYSAGSPYFVPPVRPATRSQMVKSEAIEGTTLFVGGTSTANNIQVRQSGTQVVVNLNNGGANFQTPRSGLTSLVVYDQGDNAKIQIDSHLTLPAVLEAGNGVGDHIIGGGGPTVELGGAGGNGTLQGGTGRSILIAGPGGAQLQGGNAGNILIGGYTNSDNNLAALEAALEEWSSLADYATRLTDLAAIFNGTTVHSDGQADQLQGAGGSQPLDWFFAPLQDVLSGKNSQDQVTTIS